MYRENKPASSQTAAPRTVGGPFMVLDSGTNYVDTAGGYTYAEQPSASLASWPDWAIPLNDHVAADVSLLVNAQGEWCGCRLFAVQAIKDQNEIVAYDLSLLGTLEGQGGGRAYKSGGLQICNNLTFTAGQRLSDLSTFFNALPMSQVYEEASDTTGAVRAELWLQDLHNVAGILFDFSLVEAEITGAGTGDASTQCNALYRLRT
jgi:hypothetical protein